MAVPKITGFLISIAVVSVIFGIYAIFLSNAASNYGVLYNNTQLTKYSSNLADIQSESERIKTSVENITVESGFLDKIGAYLSAAYSSLKISGESVSLGLKFMYTGIGDMALGQYAPLVRSLILIVVIILVFVGVMIASLIKRDM